ncbi:MAG: hypothetical protein DMG83_15525 [Acidobacteria bacterium]|nr:MAG: hypothetical protein DMG83_15525 [Acidobacteriota bacterium]
MDARVAKFLAFYSSFCSVLSIGFGVLVLTGWAFHIQGITTIVPHQVEQFRLIVVVAQKNDGTDLPPSASDGQ